MQSSTSGIRAFLVLMQSVALSVRSALLPGPGAAASPASLSEKMLKVVSAASFYVGVQPSECELQKVHNGPLQLEGVVHSCIYLVILHNGASQIHCLAANSYYEAPVIIQFLMLNDCC